MKNTLWDVIVCNQPEVTNIESVVFEPEEEYVALKEREKLISLLDLEGLSARELIQCTDDILVNFPAFGEGGIAAISEDLLQKYEGNPPPPGDSIVYDILYPNLFSVLALEAIGQTIPEDESPNLSNIIERYHPDSDFSKVSRSFVTDFPDELKELFGIKKKTKQKSSAYQICTQFPKLFLAELEGINSSPLSNTTSTANSLTFSKKFYDKCIRAIAPDGVWSARSFAEYYLFERTFRLNSKINLFKYNDCAEKGKILLSAKLLRTFFFHSPLVIFPHTYLKLFCRSTYPCHYEVAPQNMYLHFLIQLSSYWFPQILYILRIYTRKHGITSFDAISQFFFPASKDYLDFQEMFTPVLEYSEQELFNNRRLQTDFSNKWNEFAPEFGCCTESFIFYSLENWSAEDLDKYTENGPQDRSALIEIQNTI